MKTKLYTNAVKFYRYIFSSAFVLPLASFIILFLLLVATANAQLADANKNIDAAAKAKAKQTALETLRESTKAIWFEKNEGQFPDRQIQYGFRTSFGIIGVFQNKLRMVAKQKSNTQKNACQVVDITFPGSRTGWQINPGSRSEVTGTYNTLAGTIAPAIYNEIILKEVYAGVDLRLYSGENGSLEFDWLLNNASMYNAIKMKFEGQDKLSVDKNGNLQIDLRNEDMKITIPETYQVINGTKRLLPAKMQLCSDKETVCYNIDGDIAYNEPLVIDPVMSWSTFMHNNTKTFDEYLYTVAANDVDEIYACGLTDEAMSISYLSGVAPGFSGAYTFELNVDRKPQTSILYRLNSSGTAITAWTYTGLTTNVPVAMGIFPDRRVLVVYQTDAVQIFSPDLSNRLYNGVIDAVNIAPHINAYQSVAIADDSTFYLGGIATSKLPLSVIAANAPDTSFANREGIILKITKANTSPMASWGTYIGGSSFERFTAIAITPNKTKLAFAVHTEGSGTGYPALINAVDNNIAGSELLVGVISLSNLNAFEVFSFLGGSAHEGIASTISSAALVAADNRYFFVAGNTYSTSLPGTTGAAQPVHGLNSRYPDQFVSRIPLTGGTGSGFRTTFNGGNDVDLVGGLVIDTRTADVLLFGTTVSNDFPVYSPNPYSPYYQDRHGPFTNGTRDITYTIFSNDLASRKYSTYIGGAFDDYLGSTGKLEGTGHFQYSNSSGLTYIGTTIHSDQNSLPSQWMSGIPGFDKQVPTATTDKDSHFIFAINPNTSDYGDAPAGYDAGDAANSAVSFEDIRIGKAIDAEPKANNGDMANGDDIQNYGSADDEDGVATVPAMFAGTSTYSIAVSVFNKTGSSVQLSGWIDTDGNGSFDSYEYATMMVPNRSIQQDVVLFFSGLPPFVPISGKTYLRLRISNAPMSATSAKGFFGKGEVEDYIIPQAVILPVLIQNFTATPQNESALLSWSVGNEAAITMYEAEHSTDNIVFTKIGYKVQSNSGAYSLLHDMPSNGSNYYRIKMIMSDGSASYSPSRKINFSKYSSIGIHPNPAKDIINVYFGKNENKAVTISVLAADGKAVAKKWVALANAAESIDAANLPKGYYFVKIETADETVIKAVQVTH